MAKHNSQLPQSSPYDDYLEQDINDITVAGSYQSRFGDGFNDLEHQWNDIQTWGYSNTIPNLDQDHGGGSPSLPHQITDDGRSAQSFKVAHSSAYDLNTPFDHEPGFYYGKSPLFFGQEETTNSQWTSGPSAPSFPIIHNHPDPGPNYNNDLPTSLHHQIEDNYRSAPPIACSEFHTYFDPGTEHPETPVTTTSTPMSVVGSPATTRVAVSHRRKAPIYFCDVPGCRSQGFTSMHNFQYIEDGWESRVGTIPVGGRGWIWRLEWFPLLSTHQFAKVRQKEHRNLEELPREAGEIVRRHPNSNRQRSTHSWWLVKIEVTCAPRCVTEIELHAKYHICSGFLGGYGRHTFKSGDYFLTLLQEGFVNLRSVKTSRISSIMHYACHVIEIGRGTLLLRAQGRRLGGLLIIIVTACETPICYNASFTNCKLEVDMNRCF
ncbi:hypothetical protein L218DRAFT_948816 [Marasmius fiardii PR-910]|nr:hypothetical protein L218DRAFT_948816 [Marasmius fiardii PR-910]